MVIWGIIALFRRGAEPKVVGDQTGLSPILSLISIYVGMKIAGVAGMILGPVLCMVVINIGRLKNKEYDAVREDIRAVKQAVGDKILKVIIETCLLTEEEKEKMCDIVCEAGADYIKTSTGFSTAGANFHDVELMVKGVRGRCKVKAAGGISTVEDMETFLALGADRLGTSRAVKILNGEQAKGY